MPLRYTLALVVATRLCVIVLLRPGGGLIDSIGDFPFYRALGELSLERRPFLDFWVEYPPLFPWVLAIVERIALRLPGWPSATAPFQITLGGFLLLCDLGNVLLVRRLAARLHTRDVADRAAALYALQPFALLIGLAWFDAFPLFFLLLALDAALDRRAWLAGAALGLGGLAKLIPLVVAPAVVRALAAPREADPRAERAPSRADGGAARVLVAAFAGLLVAAALLAPFALSGSPYVAASLRATLLNRSSWETVWALIEGYWGVGTVAPIRERTVLEAADRLLHPASLPWNAITGLQALLLLALCFVPRGARTPRTVVAVATLGLYAFLLLGRGYSPQFLMYELPLLLVLWPDRRGLGYALGLTALGLLEWPIVMPLFPDRHDMIALVIVGRTALWLVVVVELLAELSGQTVGKWTMVARELRRGAAALGVLVGIALLYFGSSHMSDRGEHAPIVGYVRGLGADGDGPVLVSSRTGFYRLAAPLGAGRVVLAVDDLDASPEARLAHLRRRVDGAAGYWLVLDHSEGDAAWRDRLERGLAGEGSRATDRWLGYYHLLGFVRPDAWRGDPRWRPIDATFDGQVSLTGWLAARPTLEQPDKPLRLLFAWRVVERPKRDYKLFVHLVNDAAGQIVAQDDRPLESGGRLATAWVTGEAAVTAADLLPPAAAFPAPTRLRVGLYDGQTGARLRVGAADYVDLPGVLPSGPTPSGPAG